VLLAVYVRVDPSEAEPNSDITAIAVLRLAIVQRFEAGVPPGVVTTYTSSVVAGEVVSVSAVNLLSAILFTPKVIYRPFRAAECRQIRAVMLRLHL